MARFQISEGTRWYALGTGLSAILAVLGFLQYRANRQLRDSLQKQMRITMETSLMRVRRGLEQELSGLCEALNPSPLNSRDTNLQQYAGEFARWRSSSAHPGLVAGVFVYQDAGSPESKLLRLRADGTRFEPADWPANSGALRQRLDRLPVSPWEPRGPHGLRPDSGGPPMNDDDSPWFVDQNIPALVHRTFSADGSDGNGKTPGMANASFLIVPFSFEELSHRILPELAQRELNASGTLSFQLALVLRGAQTKVLYASDANVTGDERPDVQLSIFHSPIPDDQGGPGPGSRMFGDGPGGPPPEFREPDFRDPEFHEPEFRGHVSPNRGPGTPRGGSSPSSAGEPGKPRPAPNSPGQHREPHPVWLEAMRYTPEDRGWMLMARSGEGSVEATVQALYRRNLAVDFGVLLVLATTIATMLASVRRAHQLAQMRMDFVTSVSHELRTPLTGIVSVAQNAADGLADNKEVSKRYGAAILSQAQQLSDLIEQILLFSATEKKRQLYHFAWVDVEELIAASVSATAAMIRTSGVRVETTVSPDLPQVWGDFKALTHCLQNLIVNAIKYGGERKWVGIKAALDRSAGTAEVVITVEDKGVGIEDRELERIFEPFYRSPAVTSAQIHGSGLGLAIVKSIVEQMGGRLTVKSELGQGSSFSVHLSRVAQV